MQYTLNEIKLLKIFWKAKKPLTKREILTLNSDDSWRTNTIHHLLNSLLAKNAICEDGYVKFENAIGRKYKAVFSYIDFCLELLLPILTELNLITMLDSVICQCNDLNTLEEIKKKLKQ